MTSTVPALTRTDSTTSYFFIKCDYKYERIYFDDILYIEAMQNYVTIYTHKGKYITLLYPKNVDDNLDKQSFIRVIIIKSKKAKWIKPK